MMVSLFLVMDKDEIKHATFQLIMAQSQKLFSRKLCLATSYAKQEMSGVPAPAMVNVRYFGW